MLRIGKLEGESEFSDPYKDRQGDGMHAVNLYTR
jgi:hypothetical protein